MLHRDDRGVGGEGPSRRDFLRAGTLGAVGAGLAGLTLADRLAAGQGRADVNCILLFLVGGPSHLDTFDPKPDAPAEVRGPFRPIPTRVPGVRLAETLPRLADMADRFALVRSVHHLEPPIHETGHQLMQTGRLSRGGVEHPHYGAVLSHLSGSRNRDLPVSVVLPTPIGNTGVSVSHGQWAGYLGDKHEPALCWIDPTEIGPALDKIAVAHHETKGFFGYPGEPVCNLLHPKSRTAFDLRPEPGSLRDRYGRDTFGQSCLLARRLVEHGVRLVTVNMFDTVFNNVTWDCHADGGSLASDLTDYRDTLCPMFDRACTALLQDLSDRGMLDTTLVLAMGEFGRTPYLNPRGGRDHWPGCWSILLAGAGVRGGQVVGASDAIGAEPADRPVTPADVAATVYHALGLDPRTTLPAPEGRRLPLSDGQPIRELFG
jgi:uncharacterized protein (DUF1501 family)